MTEPMKWERVKVAAPASKKDRQPAAVFRARGPKGWCVAFDWGNGISQTLFVKGADKDWKVELDAEK
jgi:hypothetical protein